MYQVRVYLQARKPPKPSRGFYLYRLETILKSGELHTSEGCGMEENITANQLILVAFCRALNELKVPCEIEVFTDSMYLRGNYENNLQGWSENGWTNAKGEPVANRTMWKYIQELACRHRIRFSKDYQYPARAAMVARIMEMRRVQHV